MSGSFFGNAVAVFARNPKTGALSQLAGSAGCIAESSVERMLARASPSGRSRAWPSAATGRTFTPPPRSPTRSSFLTRNASTGALTQATERQPAVSSTAPLAGCATGVELSGANAVATSPGNDVVYVTSLFSNSVTTFGPTSSSVGLRQKEGTAGCLVWLRAVGCSFGQAMSAPEGLAVSPDGANVYVAAFLNGAIDVLDRNRESGSVAQKPGSAGCLAAASVPSCTRARALRGVSSIALSPDGRYLYSTSFGSNAVDIFRRNK